ncbi:MAG TPA: helix-turn-helix domain-containing protein [Acidimicrobiales bacterium]|nr:helix-turn-helix domain-containing protein [Acidimicrobiales bacterium]
MSDGQRSGRPSREDGHLVVALVGSVVAPFELGVVHEVFGIDRSEYADPWYRLRVVGAFGSTIPVAHGAWQITTPHTLDDLAEADTVVVPVWPERDGKAPDDLLDALRTAHARGARLVSVCTGAYLLAQAGLLDGRRATTHWMWADDLARTYPAVEVHPDVLFVDAGDGIFTSAGTAAGIDLCLHIVRLDHGAEVANKVARRMVVAPQRAGGQAQFVASPLPQVCTDDPIARTLDWALARLDEPMSVDDMAARALLSPRSFARRFRAATGTTPMQWLLRQRVLHAQVLLETTDLAVDRVAQLCGFGTATALRVHFRRMVGTTPVAYRRSFGPCADVVAIRGDADLERSAV